MIGLSSGDAGAPTIENVGGHDHPSRFDASCKLCEVNMMPVICPTRLSKYWTRLQYRRNSFPAVGYGSRKNTIIDTAPPA